LIEEVEVDDVRRYTNRCACGWEISGTEDEVVDATIDHGRRMHNMTATRDEVIAAMRAAGEGRPADAAEAS
jgi:predicted small metal-binding protein